MAARRLVRPALPPPLPAEQMPDQQGGGLTGVGAISTTGGSSSPAAHPDADAQGLPARWGRVGIGATETWPGSQRLG